MPNNKPSNNLRVTSGRAWRKAVRQTELVELPSGAVARLRHIGIAEVLRLGYVPDVVSPAIEKIILTGDREALADIGFEKWAALFGAVCRAAFVEPRIVDDPQEDDEIALSDVTMSDQSMVFNWATEEARLFRKFPVGESGGDLALVPDVEIVREPAE